MDLAFGKTEVSLERTKTKVKPMVILASAGDEQSKSILNSHGNYIAKAWSEENQCHHCDQDIIDLESFDETPRVLIGVFVRY